MAAARPTPSKPARRLNAALASGLRAESAFLMANHVSVGTINNNATASSNHFRLPENARDARARRVSLDSPVTGTGAAAGAAAAEVLADSVPGGCAAPFDGAAPG